MLSRLIGKKFNCVSRAIDMLCLFFGEDYTYTSARGTKIDVAEFSLHIQTQWRFREKDTILLAARDIYEPYSENVSDDWEYDLIGRADELSSVFDVKAKTLNERMKGIEITNCEKSAVNDVSIVFSNGVIFELFISSSQKAEEWRIIDYISGEHMVFHDDFI